MSTIQRKGTVHWRGQSSPLMYAGEFIFFGILAVLVMPLDLRISGIAFPLFVWFWWNGSSERYELTGTSIVIYTGLINKEVEQVFLTDIKGYEVLDTWVTRLFSVSNVLFIVDESSEFQPCVKGIRNAEHLIKKMRTLTNANSV